MKKVFVLQFGFIALATVGVLGNEERIRVNTLNGAVEGLISTSCRDRTQFARFRGIPYAQPPLGKLRFRDPVPANSWTGVYNATYQRPSCLQGGFGKDEEPMYQFGKQSEDCLYLNVYTPNVNYIKNGKGPLKAVMVFIHMGAFVMGSSSELATSPDFLMDQDVVLVTFNYRLGALGFLSLQNADVPGNAGLKDQNLVLRWVKNNIKKFGGDPDKITIFGESAGSASVGYHMISKKSAGLFKNAIMQSGTPLAPWAFSEPTTALEKAKKLAQKVGCWNYLFVDFNKILQCMQSVPAEIIRDMQQQALPIMEVLSLRIIAFNPTIEPEGPGAFLTSYPYDLIKSGNFSKVPLIIGSTADEGLLLYPLFTKYDPNGILMSLIGFDLSRFAPTTHRLLRITKIGKEIHNQLSNFYFDGKFITKKQLKPFLELISDTMFVVPIQLTTGLMSDQHIPIYNYRFAFDGSYGMGKAATNIMNVPGVSHGDDVGYIFYVPDLHKNCGRNTSAEVTSIDELMINRMTKMWSNFAKYGNPTPKFDKELEVKWAPFAPASRNYLDIGKDLIVADSLKLGNMMFWQNIQNLLKKHERGEYVNYTFMGEEEELSL